MWADIARLAPLTFEPRELTGGEIGRLCARLRRIFHDDDPLVELDLQAVLLQMFAAGFRAPRADRGARPRWLDPAIGYIREHFARKITLTELGGIAGVHPVYLAQAFSRHCGTTPAEFQRTIRMQFVCDRIRAGLSLADVAAAAGFADQSHLTRVFHRQLGMTPLAWRRATSD
jgi:AraC family transcriptional regulator